MLNDNAKKWVEALRSGQYRQGKGVLNNRDTYCCLGVACEVAVKNKVLDVQYEDYPNFNYKVYDGYKTQLPPSVMEWLGVRTPMGAYKKPYTSLAILNDYDNYTFDMIANVIESEPPGLFVDIKES